jgi:two-component system, response regulator
MSEAQQRQDAADILLVDDNPMDSELLHRALQKSMPNAQLLTLSDSDAVIEYMFSTGRYAGRTTRQPKLILVDLNLPPGGGIEVVQNLKGDPRTKRIPVVILSASQDEVSVQRCYQAGANSYLEKPINYDRFEELSRTVAPYWLKLNQLP